MIRRPPRSTPLYSSAASDVYKRQVQQAGKRRERAQRAQGSRREFRRHLGLPVGQAQVQDRSGGGRHEAAQEGRQTAQDRARKEAYGIPCLLYTSPSPRDR